MKQKFKFIDRYLALGIPQPDPKTCCPFCDGLKFTPMGKCKDCNGTGIKKLIKETK